MQVERAEQMLPQMLEPLEVPVAEGREMKMWEPQQMLAVQEVLDGIPKEKEHTVTIIGEPKVAVAVELQVVGAEAVPEDAIQVTTIQLVQVDRDMDLQAMSVQEERVHIGIMDKVVVVLLVLRVDITMVIQWLLLEKTRNMVVVVVVVLPMAPIKMVVPAVMAMCASRTPYVLLQ